MGSDKNFDLFRIKPQSLREVIRRVQAGEQQFDPSLREFLDSFYVNPGRRQQAIAEQPGSIDALHDAYVAAVAEHLARVFDLPIPDWSEGHGNGREPHLRKDQSLLPRKFSGVTRMIATACDATLRQCSKSMNRTSQS